MIQRTKPRVMKNSSQKVVLDQINELATCAKLDFRICIDQWLLCASSFSLLWTGVSVSYSLPVQPLCVGYMGSRQHVSFSPQYVSLLFHSVFYLFLKNFIKFIGVTLVSKIKISSVKFHNTSSVYFTVCSPPKVKSPPSIIYLTLTTRSHSPWLPLR